MPYSAGCGDSVIQNAELCDSPQGCEDDCTAALSGWDCADPVDCEKFPVCGDEYLSSTEECEDGNDNPLDGCDDSCMEELGWTFATTTNGTGHQHTVATPVCGDT